MARFAFFYKRIRNVPLRVHWSVALFPLGIAWVWEGIGLWSFRENLSLAVRFSFLVYTCAVLPHELAHWLAGRCFGVRGRISLFFGGGSWNPENQDAFLGLAKGKQALIYLAGPAANFLISLLSLVYQNQWTAFGQWAGVIGILNLWLGCVNLLPLVPLDGGRVFHLLLRAVPLKGWGMVGLSFLPIFGIGIPAWLWLLSHRIWVEVLVVGLVLVLGCWVLWEERGRLLACAVKRDDCEAEGGWE